MEKRLVRESRRAGGDAFKVMPVVAGFPDRLVVLPPGRMFLVETKAPGGEIRPAQAVVHARLAAMGIKVAVLWDGAQVTEWLTARTAEQ